MTPDCRRDTKSAIATEAQEVAVLMRIASRDREAISELYLIYHRRLERFLRHLTLRTEFVEDIIIDTFVAVAQRVREFPADSRVSTWILGIAYRRALTSLNTEQAGQATLPFTAKMQESWSANIGFRDGLERVLLEFPADERAVITLTYDLGCSCQEVASIVQSSVDAVKARMMDARLKLRVALSRGVWRLE